MSKRFFCRGLDGQRSIQQLQVEMRHSEAHRQFYLAAAGVRMWYAKRPLPGAAPSHEFELDDSPPADERPLPDEVPVARPPLPGSKPDSKPAGKKSVDLQSLMAPADQKAEVKADVGEQLSEQVRAHEEPASTPDSRVEVAANSHAAIAAYLCIWSTKSYVLISQWSEEASERLQESLARNLLQALHQSEVGVRQMLHWPVFRNPRIPGNSMDDFKDVLARAVSPDADRSIILLGVLSNEKGEHRQRCLEPLLARVGVDFPFSLAELSAASLHKRDLWHALKSNYSV